ncbi:hypothetical protein I7I48_09493 [Histoplasma ohiense]|nr:hypothetical protein I7I48_09493 [Histoplasma ohiense (nom. inval.)]
MTSLIFRFAPILLLPPFPIMPLTSAGSRDHGRSLFYLLCFEFSSKILSISLTANFYYPYCFYSTLTEVVTIPIHDRRNRC